MITIYDKNNKKKLEVGVNEGSIRKYTLMKEDYIRLKFTTTENVPLLIGDYVDLTSYIAEYGHDKFNNAEDDTTKLFVVDRNFFPTYDSDNGGWKYDVQINAYYYTWENKVFKYVAENGMAEVGFNLTDGIGQHAGLIKDNIDYAGITYQYTDKEGDNEVAKQESINVKFDKSLEEKGLKWIHYQSLSILGAIKLIAETYECEWWIVRNEVNFGTRKLTDDEGSYLAEIPLDMNKDLSHSTTSKAEGLHATRIYPFGGTTNVPKHYRDALNFTVSQVTDDGIGVYDNDKPVKTSMFIDTTPMPKESHSFDGGSAWHGIYDNYISDEKIELGGIELLAGKHSFVIKNFEPSIKFVKAVARGYDNTKLSVAFNWKLQLESRDNIVELTHGTLEFSEKLEDLREGEAYGADWVDARLGFIGEGGTFRTSGTKRDYVDIYKFGGKACIAEAKNSGNYDKICMFSTTGDNDLDKNDTWCRFLTPREGHSSDTYYSIFLDSLSENLIVQRSQRTPSKVREASGAKRFTLTSGEKSVEKPIPQDGYYTLNLYISIGNVSGFAMYEDGKKPMLVFDTHVNNFSIDAKREAKLKNTYIKFKDEDGDEHETDVVINPTFRDDKYKESSLIKIVGDYRLKVGDKFQLPEIMRSVVAEEHGNWFEVPDTDTVKGSVVEKRIMLPEGKPPYVQADGVSDEDAVEAIVTYDWIYPKTEMEVLEVIDGEIGSDENKERVWAVRVNIENFTSEMQVPNATLYGIFQDGDSVGLKYELVHLQGVDNWKYYGTDNGITFTNQDFWLKPNTDWGEEIPHPNCLPKEGDHIIFEGIEISYFDFNAIGNAEEALLEQATKDIETMAKENVVVDVTLRSDYAYNNGRIGIGQPVNIKGVLNKDFPSRIIGFEEKLDYMYDSPKYAVGDSNYSSKLGAIESNISEIQKESYALGKKGGEGKGVVVISSTDNITRPSETNVYSAERVNKRFLHNDKDEELNGSLDIKKELSVGGNSELNGDLSVGGNFDTSGNSNVGGDSIVNGSQEVRGSSNVGGNMAVNGELRVRPRKSEEDSNTGLLIGDFIEQGDKIQGAKITKDGIASFAAIKTPSLQVYELVYNRETAVQGEFIFSDGDTVESVTYVTEDGEYTSQQVEYGEFTPTCTDGKWNFKYIHLGLKVPYDGYVTTFAQHDILYSNINNIGASGESARTGKCFMRILKDSEFEGVVGVSDEGTSLNVYLYAHGETPSADNMLPMPHMTITRHGNAVNTDRQDIFLISSEDGRLAQLTGVKSPIINAETAYGIVLGRLPQIIIDRIKNAGYSYVNPDQPYLYARGAVIQDLILIDYKGKVIKTQNYRGLWVAPTEAEESQYRVTETMYDTVTHNGSLWQCNVDMTTEEPRGGINDWLLLVAKGQDPVPMATNIFNNTSFEKVGDDGVPEGWGKVTNKIIEVLDKTASGIGANALKIIKASSSVERRIIYQSVKNKLSASSWYTLSFSAKRLSESDVDMMIQIRNNSAHKGYLNGEEIDVLTGGVHIGVSSEWTQYYLTFITRDDVQDANIEIGFGADEGEIGYTYAISKVKLEYASDQLNPQDAIPSAWMESSEDLRGPQGNGVTIVSTDVSYSKSDSGTTKPTSWVSELPTVENGMYLWARTMVTYSDGNITDTYTVSRMGVDGRGIKSSVVTYSQQPSPVDPESIGNWGAFPDTLNDGEWLYTRTLITYYNSDGTDGEQTASYSVSQIGVGSYYAGLEEWYAIHDNDSTPPEGFIAKDQYGADANLIPTGIWSQARPKTTTAKPYLWNFSISRDSRGNAYVTDVVCIGNFARGIVSVKELYAISQYSEPNGDGGYPTDIESWDNEQMNSAPTKEKPYQWNQTATTYNDGNTEYVYHVSAVRGDDGEAGPEAGPIYEIVPSVTTIYVRHDGTMTVDEVDVFVGETTPHGYYEIKSASELTKKGLALSYSFDGNSYTPITSLDKAITVAPTSESLYLRLTGKAYKNLTIPVVHQGDTGNAGKDAITLHAEPASINVLVDAQDGSLVESSQKVFRLFVYAKDPWDKLPTKDYSVVLPNVDKFSFSTPTVVDDMYTFTAELSDDVKRTDIADSFLVTFNRADSSSLGTLPVSISISERGFVGPAGDNGAMLLPYGYWSAETAYKLLRDSNGKVVGRPLVYYVEQGATKGTYFVLQKDIPEKEVGKVDTSITEYWTPFQEYKAIYTEALMADYAKFGDDNGAIFFKQFLFSQRGQGNKDYSHFLPDNSEGNRPIFIINEKGQYELSGSFNPKLHLDFLNGLANLSCLCEPYVVPEAVDGVVQIDMESGFNVKIPYDDWTLTRPILVLPKLKDAPSWYKNGAHVEIMYESGGSDFASHVNEYILNYPATAKGKFILICVDNPCDEDDGIEDSMLGWNGESYIMCRGKRAKYLILGVGGYVRFRAVEVGNTTMWYVTTEGNVSEEKVDIYSRYDRGGLYDDADGYVTYEQYKRVQFYGSDYSVEINMQEQQEGVACRSLMLYSGPEGLCPRNIKFTSGENLGYPHYEVVPSSEISYFYEVDGEEYIGGYGPILGD